MKFKVASLFAILALFTFMTFTPTADATNHHLTAGGVSCDSYTQGVSIIMNVTYPAGVHCFNGAVSIPIGVSAPGIVTFDIDGILTTAALSQVTAPDSTWVITGAFNAGAGSTMENELHVGGAVTLGGTTFIYGDIVAGTTVSTGIGSEIHGDVTAGTTVTTGAASFIYGDVTTNHGAVTTGAGTFIDGDVYAGTTATLGANTFVNGDVISPAAVTMGAGSQVECVYASPVTMGAGATATETICVLPVVEPTEEELCNQQVGWTWIDEQCLTDEVETYLACFEGHTYEFVSYGAYTLYLTEQYGYVAGACIPVEPVCDYHLLPPPPPPPHHFDDPSYYDEWEQYYYDNQCYF